MKVWAGRVQKDAAFFISKGHLESHLLNRRRVISVMYRQRRQNLKIDHHHRTNQRKSPGKKKKTKTCQPWILLGKNYQITSVFMPNFS